MRPSFWNPFEAIETLLRRRNQKPAAEKYHLKTNLGTLWLDGGYPLDCSSIPPDEKRGFVIWKDGSTWKIAEANHPNLEQMSVETDVIQSEDQAALMFQIAAAAWFAGKEYGETVAVRGFRRLFDNLNDDSYATDFVALLEEEFYDPDERE